MELKLPAGRMQCGRLNKIDHISGKTGDLEESVWFVE